MLKIIAACTAFLFLTGCVGSITHSDYPSMQQKCKLSNDNNSEACKIYAMKDLSQDEKEQRIGSSYLSIADQKCDKAKYWFEKAAKANNAIALNDLGMIFMTGCNVEQDYQQAETYFIQAHRYGSQQAAANLGGIYREGGYGIAKNLEKARYWFQQGFSTTQARSYDGMALTYLDEQEYEKAYPYIVKAATLGYPQSEHNLGYMYYSGIVVDQDKEKAKYWFEKAASQGHAKAKHYLNILDNEEHRK